MQYLENITWTCWSPYCWCSPVGYLHCHKVSQMLSVRHGLQVLFCRTATLLVHLQPVQLQCVVLFQYWTLILSLLNFLRSLSGHCWIWGSLNSSSAFQHTQLLLPRVCEDWGHPWHLGYCWRCKGYWPGADRWGSCHS